MYTVNYNVTREQLLPLLYSTRITAQRDLSAIDKFLVNTFNIVATFQENAI